MFLLARFGQATEGTIIAAFSAYKNQIGINLNGGFHHCNRYQGSGFCQFNDIFMAISELRRVQGPIKVLVIDLDGHQGNGHARDFQDDPETWTIDMFRADIYPGDSNAIRKMNMHQADVQPFWSDDQQMEQLGRLLEKVKNAGIEFCMQVAGTDCLRGDRLCGLKISEAGIMRRDMAVQQWCMQHKVKFCMTLAGGQSENIGKVIGDSVVQIMDDQRNHDYNKV